MSSSVVAAATTSTKRYTRTSGGSAHRVGREGRDQRGHLGSHLVSCRRVADGQRDERGHARHLRNCHALRRHRWRADPNAGRDARRLGVVRNGVLVQHDACGVAPLLGLSAGDAELAQVDQREVGVGPATDGAHALGHQPLGECLGVAHHRCGVGGVGGRGGLGQRHRLGGDGVHQRTALHHREDRLVDGLRVLGTAKDHAAARAAEHLVRGEGDDVGVGHGGRDRLAGDQPDEVGSVDHEDRPHLVGHLTEGREVDEAGDRRPARDDHLRSVLARQVAHLVVVDLLGVARHAVVHRPEPRARERDLGAVGEVAAVRQTHRQVGVARLQERPERGDVRARPRVRLQVGVLGAEQLDGALHPERLGLVDLGAAAVVPTARVALRVLVRQRGPQRRQHRRRGEVLTGDQLQPGALPAQLGQHDVGDRRVGGSESVEVGSPEGHVDLRSAG
jgi:hypothetical protein